MSIAYESISTQVIASSDSVTITKPSGLAVGDYMFARIISANSAGINTPSGWTSLYNANNSLSGASVDVAIFYKRAESADVSASNFTFTVADGGTEHTGGSIIRVSDFGIIEGSISNVQGSISTSTMSFASGIDPAQADNLLIYFLVGADNNSITGQSLTNPAIATSNPTWTSRESSAYNVAGLTLFFNTFTATRTQDTAFGNASYDLDEGTASAVGVVAFLMSLSSVVNDSVSVPTATIEIVNHPFLRNTALEIDGDNPTTNTLNNITQWTNQDKPTVSDVNNIEKP